MPFLEDFIISRRSFLSAQSSLSISVLDAFRLRLTPLNSTPAFARTERRRPPAAARRASRGRPTRAVEPGEEVTWGYGDLSNEELWLWYGFVPDPPAHAGSAVTFSLPEAALRAGLASVASGDSEEEAAARESLLVKAGRV